jgi:hypothetical protein
MADIHEQLININFVPSEQMFAETRKMMKIVYGGQCMSRTRCYEWFTRFEGDL